MKTFHFSLAMLLCVFAPLLADEERRWIQCPNGIAVSMVLSSNSIEIHLKNTSDELKEVVLPWFNISVYYVDGHRQWIRLGQEYGDRRGDPLDEIDGSSGPSHWDIQPHQDSGETITVHLYKNEPLLVRKFPVVFSTIIRDLEAKATVKLESPPTLLGEAK